MERWAAVGGEDIPSVKGITDRLELVLFPVQREGCAAPGHGCRHRLHKGGGCFHPGAVRRRHDTVLLKEVCEQPVVRRKVPAPRCDQQQRAARCAHSGVNDDDVDRLGRKVGARCADNKGGVRDVLRWDLVGYVNQMRFGVDAENHAFHGRRVSIRASQSQRLA